MVVVFGLLLYIVIPTVGGGKDQSVFSASFWYSYGCSLFCEYQCIVYLLCMVTYYDVHIIFILFIRGSCLCNCCCGL